MSTSVIGNLSAYLHHQDGKEINEEELFTSVIRMRIAAKKGSDGLQKFDETLETLKKSFLRPDGRFQLEDVTVAALDMLVKKRVLTKTDREKLYKDAFTAAQLDEKKDALYDSIGGRNDPTRAVASVGKATTSALKILSGIDSGTITAAAPGSAGTKATSGVAATTGKLDGQGGFLFKPVSNNEGTLAVILPKELSQGVQSVVIKDSDGKSIESGRFKSFGDNGTNAKFTFRKPGGSYPKNITVEVELRGGEKRSYSIKDPSMRYD